MVAIKDSIHTLTCHYNDILFFVTGQRTFPPEKVPLN